MAAADDMSAVFGKGAASAASEPAADDTSEEMPAGFESAFTEYQDSPTAENFWRAVKACTETY